MRLEIDRLHRFMIDNRGTTLISSCDFCFALQSLSIVMEMELALLCKAFLNYGIGFASQCQTILIDLFCFAKSILYDGVALLRKAFPS